MLSIYYSKLYMNKHFSLNNINVKLPCSKIITAFNLSHQCKSTKKNSKSKNNMVWPWILYERMLQVGLKIKHLFTALEKETEKNPIKPHCGGGTNVKINTCFSSYSYLM